MAKLLIVDEDGVRRVHTEALAQTAGHRTYNAGTVAEAVRSAEIYVPEVVLIASKLPDGTPTDLVKTLRASAHRGLREALVLSIEAVPGDPRVSALKSARPAQALEAVAAALASRGQAS